ncbi:MAG TPA: DUF4410 domain-containing protein [Rhizomicrobium sp.]|jgi:hypothetical protein
MNQTRPFPGTTRAAPTLPLRKSSPWQKVAVLFLSCTMIGLALSGCATTNLSVQDVSPSPGPRPAVVYVADFELPPDSIQSETLAASYSQIHAYFEQSKARSLVVTMSNAIVSDLVKKGIVAQRLPANGQFPKKGWLVRGVFMKIDEGNRMKRAIIGFGSGQTDLEVDIATDDLSANTTPTPLYRAQMDATSNKLPGAVVTLNPFVAAAKYVLAGHDLDHSTRATAEKITDQIVARVMGTPQGGQHT